ncbi:cytochrome P450 [Streptomyces flavofungini]|uniref:Cytochrome P450 n=1 Tax=Streptomyces flavofungini TaxID=68200 RepID=A0ABS0X1N3_9ACTN|nr:cytochrome P450 [Streptomyces flavofungini]MBJ3807097.1 cytochrome P450 [Streptomyces flavofungini]GHC75028.1 cytochrome P450 [Streptomyces flavofungini]
MSTVAESGTSWQDLPFLDITVPDFAWDSPEVAEARERSWVAGTPLGLLVLRYAEAHSLSRDPRLVSGFRDVVDLVGPSDGLVREFMRDFMQSLEGPDHRRLRGLVTHAFTARRITALRPFIRATAERLADELAAGGERDFVAAFADPLPAAVVCELLGFPPEDHATVGRWCKNTNLVLALGPDQSRVGEVEEGLAGMYEYFETVIQERKAHLGDDLFSDILRAQQENGALDDRELRTLIATLLVAGYQTTSHQLGHAMVAFAAHPDQWPLLRKQPELVTQAVEEVLRWCPTTTVVATKSAAEDFAVNDLRIQAGTPVWLCAHSAQRDPLVFKGGDAFDITVKREASPLAFGGGAHYCLGAALARVELAEALDVLAARLGPPEVAGPITWRPSTGVSGPDVLPLRFGAAATA